VSETGFLAVVASPWQDSRNPVSYIFPFPRLIVSKSVGITLIPILCEVAHNVLRLEAWTPGASSRETRKGALARLHKQSLSTQANNMHL
jgi:hypothetical protein